ncbi:MAG: radical SAM protein [Acidobacteria bacterium]|nr:radical SAM protein [Acidobacteriota bacterium]
MSPITPPPDKLLLLFDLAPLKPTTREVANQVRAHGMAQGLSGAAHLADGASYQEVICRSALNPVKGMPFEWTLNPYRGCTHGCHYCFARRYHTQFELGSGDEFSSIILVKKNFVDVLRRELDRPSWRRQYVAFGTATDVYQPIEGHYKITRRSLEALALARTPVGLITKGPMVVRDKDVLLELTRQASCTVYVSVPTVDEDAWRILEPGTAHPLQRLRAVRELTDAGIRAGVLVNPIVPGLTSQPAKLENTIKAIADHGAAFMGTNLLYLKEGTRLHFMGFLEKQFPELWTKYQRLYTGAYAPPAYAKEVRGIVKLLQSKYGVSRRGEDDPPGEKNPPGEGEQKAFDWTTETVDRRLPTYPRFISALIRCSVGGCVLNMLNKPPAEKGLMMNMWAVAGLASSGICFDPFSSFRSAFTSP